MKMWAALMAGVMLAGTSAGLLAQDAPRPTAPPAGQRPAGPPPIPALGDGPFDVDSADAKLHIEVVARGMDHPWGLAFLPDGGMLVTERPGRLRVIRNGVLDPRTIEGLPAIFNPGISGLTDVVLDPNFASNRLIYLAYSKAAPDTPAGASPMQTDATLAVMRAKWDGGYRLTDVKDIYVANEWYGKPPLAEKCCGQGPASGSFGGRLAIGADGKLYVSSGDRNFGERAQDPASAFGKILRLELDGSPARDNPFTGRAGWLPEIWSIGHRNPTGMAFDPATGRLWETEFGPRGGDEINIIQRGGNYGWMDVTQGYHYNSEPAKGVREVEGKIDPIWAFGPPSANPGNIAVYRGSAFPAWEGNLLIAMMNRSLVRMKLSSDGHVVGQEVLLQNLSQRLRDVRVAPDGAVYILTDETDGALLKITPRS